MMKRLLTILLLLTLVLPAMAEMDGEGNIVIALPDAEMYVLPLEEGAPVLTRESSASEFNRLGMSQRELLPQMEAYGIYALLYDAALTTELQLRAYPTQEQDFSELTEYGEAMVCADIRNQYTEAGYDVRSAEMYSVPGGLEFVRLIARWTDETGAVQGVAVYLTVEAGYEVSLCVYADGEFPTQEQIDMGDMTADSIWLRSTVIEVYGN